MKGTLLLIFMSAVFSTLRAFTGFSPTINANDVPKVNTLAHFVHVKPFALHPGEPGTNKNWIYTNLESINRETASWSDPAFFGENLAFIGANLVSRQAAWHFYEYLPSDIKALVPISFFERAYVRNVENQGFYYFGSQNNRIIERLSNGDTLVIESQNARVDPAGELIVPFPLRVGAEFGNLSYRQEIRVRRQRAGVRLDDIRIIRNFTKHIVADAEGTMSTPFRNYEGVIRVRTETQEVDSIYIEQQIENPDIKYYSNKYWYNYSHPTRYSWYAPDEFEVFTLFIDKDQKPVRAYYRVDANPVVRYREFGVRVRENAGVIRVPVWLSRPSELPIAVDYETGTTVPAVAVPGVDYVHTSGKAIFRPGDTLAFVNIEILEDDIHEPTKAFYLKLSNPLNADLGAIRLFAIEVEDNDKPYISFAVGDMLAYEDSLVAYVPIVLDAPSQTPISVRIKTTPISAEPFRDFVPVNPPVSVTMPAGSKLIRFPITLIDNNLLQDTLSFRVSMEIVSENARMGYFETIDVGIIDDDFKPAISFRGPKSIRVAEATNNYGNVVKFTVGMSYPSVEPATVQILTVDSTAVKGLDYEAANFTLRFAPGELQKEVSILILNNTVAQDNKSRVFHVRLGALSSNVQYGDNRQVRIEVTENDLITTSRSSVASDRFELYPNPAVDVINIRADVLIQDLRMINQVGQMVRQVSGLGVKSVVLPTDGLAPGVYTIQTKSEIGIVNHHKVVITK